MQETPDLDLLQRARGLAWTTMFLALGHWGVTAAGTGSIWHIADSLKLPVGCVTPVQGIMPRSFSTGHFPFSGSRAGHNFRRRLDSLFS